MGSIASVLFDLGGTLFSYARLDEIRRPALLALERCGVPDDEALVAEARRVASLQIERDYASRSSFLHRDLFRDRVARTAQLLGASAPQEVLDRFDDENRQAILDNLVPRSDARATLESLKKRGVYTAVVSNADDDYLEPLLRKHRLTELLDDWTSSEEAVSCKPDVKIYQYALAKSRRSAGNTLFVGDSLQHDIAGAHAVGMRSALIGSDGATAPLSQGLVATVEVDFTVRDLTEVVDIVDRLSGESH